MGDDFKKAQLRQTPDGDYERRCLSMMLQQLTDIRNLLEHQVMPDEMFDHDPSICSVCDRQRKNRDLRRFLDRAQLRAAAEERIERSCPLCSSGSTIHHVHEEPKEVS